MLSMEDHRRVLRAATATALALALGGDLGVALRITRVVALGATLAVALALP